MAQGTYIYDRLHIAILGRRNAGKSSLINALTQQETALVSDRPGTTTDPVQKSMELPPIGPVTFIDTAGFDDEGSLGEQRVERTRKVIEKTDLALLVFDAAFEESLAYELSWYKILRDADIPVIGVVNKKDLLEDPEDDRHLIKYKDIFPMDFILVSSYNKEGMNGLKNMIAEAAPIPERDSLVGELVEEGDLVLLVMPQDKEAPKGRLILPQSQAIRDVVGKKAIGINTSPETLEQALSSLTKKPDLVITDSGVFGEVNAVLPQEVPLTSFSILMAHFKGDIADFREGTEKIDGLGDGDKILVAESCSHHATKIDIGREKIPQMLKAYTKKELSFEVSVGADFPQDLSKYALVIHCGACMFNRKQMMTRILQCRIQNVPITNYGMVIAHMKGILDRTISVF